ncbi:hypothetical protein KDA_25180 [Dictyobacter alpinus]|uniref:Circadian input-output histidine kinase CikA n=1 Tax=Dictyobacter alpinus TaxID=2014873 RepID=A0A402B6R2_9CHLR|nr:ATP-binding protein [Dictyobacter alpinus]GCE27034.1 hypothetical protein KDA_25180 [Dictyobacter alpinus]
MTSHKPSIYDRKFLHHVPSFDADSQDLLHILRTTTLNVSSLFPDIQCTVALLDPSATSLMLYSSSQATTDKLLSIPFQPDSSVEGWVIEQRTALALPDDSSDKWTQDFALVDEAALFSVPLIYQDICIGALTITSEMPVVFSEQTRHIISTFANQAVPAIWNVQHLRTMQQMGAQLERDQHYLRTILAASSDGIAMINDQQRFIEVNPAFGQMFNLPSEQLVDRTCADIFGCHNEPKPMCCHHGCMIEHALSHEEALDYTEVDIHTAGSNRLLGISVTPVALKNAPVCLVVARDMTAVRDAERGKAKFLSMITHELRSPLNAINGYLDLLLSGVGGELTPDHHEFVQRARAGSENLYALLEDLLLISRADSGQMRLNRELIRLPDVIENAAEELELTAADNGIQMHIDIAPDLPRLYADAVRLQQVLRNLINNALQFTPAGGSVLISAKRAEVGHSVSATSLEADDEPQAMLQLQVKDTGCGIDPEFHQRIFERFFQAPNDRIRQAGGQGLGLAIVKMLIELHHGTVTIESTPGQGSTFTCLLPCLLN